MHVKKADIAGVRIAKAINKQEWEVVKRFRQIYFFGPQNMEDPYEWTFSHQDHYHFLLYKQEEIVGYAHVQLWPKESAIIRIMVIDKHLRSQGLGQELMQQIEAWLITQKYFTLCVDSRQGSVRFYEKCGFEKAAFIDPEGYESDPQDIQMQKQLI